MRHSERLPVKRHSSNNWTTAPGRLSVEISTWSSRMTGSVRLIVDVESDHSTATDGAQQQRRIYGVRTEGRSRDWQSEMHATLLGE